MGEEPAKSKSGAWIIAGAIVLSGLLVAIAVYLSRTGGEPGPSPLATPQQPPAAPTTQAVSPPGESAEAASSAKQDLAAQRSLQAALDSARKVRAATSSFARANSEVMVDVEPRFTYEPAGNASTGPTNLSVLAAGTFWSAAALSHSGTCFWIKHSDDTGQTTYGIGTPCTGASAVYAKDAGW